MYQAFRWWGVGTLRLFWLRLHRVYQAFRWWGVGTDVSLLSIGYSVSGIPMVGCRNVEALFPVFAFSVSGIPMVGCRN